MRDSDQDTITNYSVGYIAKNVGRGYESWWAYMTARDTEEQALRSYYSGKTLRDGTVNMLPDHKNVVMSQVNMGTGVLDRMVRVMRSTRGPSETCCFLRFLDAIDLSILENIVGFLELSTSMREANIHAAYEEYMKLANHPWNVISGEVLSLLDEFFDEVAKDVLSIIDLESEGMKIAKACIPIDELIGSVLDVIEYTKTWYRQMIAAIGENVNSTAATMAVGWDEALNIKKSKESTEALKKMIEYKKTAEETDPIEDNRLNAMIAELQGVAYAKQLEGVGDTIGVANDFTRSMVEACRSLGDWDKVKESAAKALES